ncbi:hypothetical protein EON83_19465 [bacterium]|nr:MAG: hypothetical protein EON83_19465 [bacterium]
MKTLPLESFLFQPKSRLSPVFIYPFESVRHLQVFRWEGRLVAYEQESELWWCTLDVCGEIAPRTFWRQCVANGRVGQLYSVERGFQRVNAMGVTMVLGPYSLYVVVAQDNSGIACIHGESVWRSFPAGEVRGINKPLAIRPTIWSVHFQPKFAFRALDVIGDVFLEDVVARMPKLVRELWEEGAGALPIRLVAAALAFGWANSLKGNVTAKEFWKGALSGRAGLVEARALPSGLLRSPEAVLPGYFTLPRISYVTGRSTTVFVWQQSKVMLRLEFRTRKESAHELMEQRLDLRDWLRQFFSAGEVEMLFK